MIYVLVVLLLAALVILTISYLKAKRNKETLRGMIEDRRELNEELEKVRRELNEEYARRDTHE